MSFLEISPKILQFMVREVQLGEEKKHPLRTPSRPDHTIFDLKDHLILGKITHIGEDHLILVRLLLNQSSCLSP